MNADNAIITCRKCGAKYSALQDLLHCGRCHAPLLVSDRKKVTVNASDIDFAHEVLASPEAQFFS